MKKVCLITGGSSGIGAALVEAYAASGFHVVFTGRRDDCLKKVESKVKVKFPTIKVISYKADVCDDEQMAKVHKLIKDQFGRLDVFIANAGFAMGGHFEKLTLEDYRRQFEVNVFGVIKGIKLFLDSLKKTKGSIAIIGSVNSYLSLPSVSAYAMSKHAVLAFAESIREEFKPFGVSVTMICPGFVKSDIRSRNIHGEKLDHDRDYAYRLAMEPDKAARQIKHAIDKRKVEKIITWHGYFAITLRRIFPSIARFLARFQKRDIKQ